MHKKWTPQEENDLRKLVAELGEEQWAAVAERMGTRSEKSVETHWKVLTGQRTASGYGRPRAQPLKAAPAIDARASSWVEVYWAGEGEWFLGRIVGQRRRSGCHETKVAYADGETIYQALRSDPFDGDGEPPAVADGEPEPWRRAPVPPVRKVAIDVDGLVERAVPIRPTGKPRARDRYASATTAREYVSLGGSTADLKYDLVNGFFLSLIHISEPTRPY